jgi:alkylmercury lyase
VLSAANFPLDPVFPTAATRSQRTEPEQSTETDEKDHVMNEAMMSASRTVRQSDGREAFTAYLKRRVLTENTPELQKVSVTLYKLLGLGSPVTHERLLAGCGLSKGRIEQLLLEFPATNLQFDERGQVVAFGGLSLVPTHHRFDTKDAGLYTWCVFDALFLPEILGKLATLVTHCPGSGAEITVELAPGRVRSASPSGCVMSIVSPDSNACCDNLRKAFCDHVNLFKDEQTFIAWSQLHQDVGNVTLREAQVFARQRNALRYPDVELHP